MEDALDLNSVILLIVIALACGLALIRLRQPAIVGLVLSLQAFRLVYEVALLCAALQSALIRWGETSV